MKWTWALKDKGYMIMKKVTCLYVRLTRVSLVMFNAERQFGGTLNHHGNTSPDIPLRVFLDQLFDEVRHVVDLATFHWQGSLTEWKAAASRASSFISQTPEYKSNVPRTFTFAFIITVTM